MAGRAVGEGGCASDDKLLGLGIADDDGIVVAAVDSCISVERYKACLLKEGFEAIQALRILRMM